MTTLLNSRLNLFSKVPWKDELLSDDPVELVELQYNVLVKLLHTLQQPSDKISTSYSPFKKGRFMGRGVEGGEERWRGLNALL